MKILLKKISIRRQDPEAGKNAKVNQLHKKGDEIITNRLTRKLDEYQPPE